MSIFIINIGIIGPLFHFDYINFKVSLTIKIKFKGSFKMAYLTMLFIFHVNGITCQNFSWSHIHCIFIEKTHFWKKNSNELHGIQTWFNISTTFIKIKNHLNCFWNIFLFLSTEINYICFHKYIPISHFNL
jgi:hypothetical protein